MLEHLDQDTYLVTTNCELVKNPKVEGRELIGCMGFRSLLVGEEYSIRAHFTFSLEGTTDLQGTATTPQEVAIAVAAAGIVVG